PNARRAHGIFLVLREVILISLPRRPRRASGARRSGRLFGCARRGACAGPPAPGVRAPRSDCARRGACAEPPAPGVRAHHSTRSFSWPFKGAAEETAGPEDADGGQEGAEGADGEAGTAEDAAG